jgi:DNA repair protein RadD
MRLRPYQVQAEADTYAAWADGARNVLTVLPTGGGKTVLFGKCLNNLQGAGVAVAHRSELVSQMSMSLARFGLRHRIIGPTSLQRTCNALHIDELKRSFVDPGARIAAAGVDTLIKRDTSQDSWFRQVQLWVEDEAHHVLKENKWGKSTEMFPNAYGLGVTATPVRADGKGLGAHADGVFQAMVLGPTMRQLIEMGYLTDYRVIAPPSDLDLSHVDIAAGGDYSPPQVRAAVHRSHITGDIVTHYLKWARGKLGVTFAVDVEAATEIAAAYRAAGVPAEVVSAKTPDHLRVNILKRFRTREILQLVNVDLFGEGFDLPAIEVVSMGRPTASYSLYCQQFGRALRLMVSKELQEHWDHYTDEQRCAFILASGKPKALILDHVGNVNRHKLPDAFREWSLDRRERRSGKKSDGIPVTSCLNPACNHVYERYHVLCPYCGHRPEPASRSGPEFVDGDLIELDPDVLKAMRGEIAKVDDMPFMLQGVDAAVNGAIKRRHWERQQAQAGLREQIALWAGWQTKQGHGMQAIYRLFYFKFGTDVATAQALGTPEATALQARIKDVLDKRGIYAVQRY